MEWCSHWSRIVCLCRDTYWRIYFVGLVDWSIFVLISEYRNTTVLFFMSVTFNLTILVRFSSNPWFKCQYPCFILINISSIFRCGLSCVWCANEGGEVGSHGWRRIVHGFAHGIILSSGLICQHKAQFWVQVWLLSLQGTDESRSTDNTWVWPRNCNCDTNVNSNLQVQNGFIHFLCHERVNSNSWVWPGPSSLLCHQQK